MIDQAMINAIFAQAFGPKPSGDTNPNADPSAAVQGAQGAPYGRTQGYIGANVQQHQTAPQPQPGARPTGQPPGAHPGQGIPSLQGLAALIPHLIQLLGQSGGGGKGTAAMHGAAPGLVNAAGANAGPTWKAMNTDTPVGSPLDIAGGIAAGTGAGAVTESIAGGLEALGPLVRSGVLRKLGPMLGVAMHKLAPLISELSDRSQTIVRQKVAPAPTESP